MAAVGSVCDMLLVLVVFFLAVIMISVCKSERAGKQGNEQGGGQFQFCFHGCSFVLVVCFRVMVLQ
jgi:hypothetical protein